MVPLQVSMKHVKQKKPPKENIKVEPSPDNDSDSADEKVKKWLAQRGQFQQQKEKSHSRNEQGKGGRGARQQKNTPQERAEGNDSMTKAAKKSGRKRLAANFGPT